MHMPDGHDVIELRLKLDEPTDEVLLRQLHEYSDRLVLQEKHAQGQEAWLRRLN